MYLLVLMRSVSALLGAVAAFFAVVLGLSLIGAGTLALARHPWRSMSTRERTFTASGLTLGLALLSFVGVLLTGDGKPVERHTFAPEGLGLPHLTASNPALRGPYQVHTLTYGNGTDRHRREYGEAVELTTPTFDVSAFVSRWTSSRTRYWGFRPEAVPLNATVWYPEGDGPFPLVLMVHGNAEMTRGSDQGYEYLGELLASRGYIFASVDQNFLNYSYWTDFLFISPVTGENDARAILLLEHLKLWQAWNETPQHPFHNKVDMSRIALGGHSRGGEAVAIASAFNQLAHYPDDATIPFDYRFDIGTVFALAPTEGMYTPANRPLVIENVDYLVLHGAHDMDVISFMGAAQYDRVQLQQDDFAFKSAVYVEHANHGQFNTVWGRNDVQRPALWLLNRAQLLPAEEQRRIAEV